MNSQFFNLSELPSFARRFASQLDQGQWLFLEGQIGSGKTTFVRSLMIAEGDERQDISSPTFAILNSYEPSLDLAKSFDVILHLDLYRINDLSELLFLGLDLSVTERSLVIFEWPDRFPREDWISFLIQSGVPSPKVIKNLKISVCRLQPDRRRYDLTIIRPDGIGE